MHGVRYGVAAGLLALVLAVPAGAGLPTGGPNPVVVAHSWRAQEQIGPQRYFLSWAEPGRYAERRGWSLARRPWLLETAVQRAIGETRFDDGSVEKRPFLARPDAYWVSDQAGQYAEFALAQARGGKRTLASGTLGGVAVWRTTVAVRANDCAGLRAGSVKLWLSKRNLLPLKISETRGKQTLTRTFSYRRVNDDLPASDFALPRLGPHPFRVDTAFRKSTPGQAAAHLSYTPELPTALPSGFRLGLAGWRPRSGITGAEGSNPRYDGLFGAVYRRGVERIDVTQRLAGPGWQADPFGGECLFQFEEGATVNGQPAFYGIGPEIPPHLYWQDGSLLYTVSGPYTKQTLVAIAESLAPIS
jgi:hypothetical protein